MPSHFPSSSQLVMFALLLLPACGMVPIPKQADLDAAPIGAQPTEQGAKELAALYLSTSLKDPASAIVNFYPVRRGYYHNGMSMSWTYAWVLPASVNAKNSFGGYVGASEWDFFFRDGDRLVAVTTPDSSHRGYNVPITMELEKPLDRAEIQKNAAAQAPK